MQLILYTTFCRPTFKNVKHMKYSGLHKTFLIWVFAFSSLVGAALGQSNGEVTVIVQPNQSVRQISEKYLGDPDLWEDILRANGLQSAADLYPGVKLRIPVKAISDARKALEEAHQSIQKATDSGAKLFAPDEISQAIYLHESAISKRQESDWSASKNLAESAAKEARKAIEICKSKEDVSAQAVVHYKEGAVQKRNAENVVWNDTEVNDLLDEGDRIRTLSESYSEVLFRDDSRLRLSANSQAFIQKIRTNLIEGRDEADIKLVEGDVLALLQTGKKKSKFELEVPGVETNIRSKKFWISKNKSEAKFANYDGELELSASGGKVLLKENQGSVIKEGKEPTRPEQLLPKPILTHPENAIDIFDWNVNLEWDDLKGADDYIVEIAADGAFSKIVKSVKTSQGKIKIPDNLSGGLYHWQVKGISKEGLPGLPSLSRTFRLIKDDDPPYLVVETPDDNEITAERAIIVSGNVEPGVELIVNGSKIKISENGKFHTETDLTAGENIIKIEAIDPANNKTTITRKVNYSPDEEIFIEFDPKLNEIALNNKTILFTQTAVYNLKGITKPFAAVKVENRETKHVVETSASDEGKFTVNLICPDQESHFVIQCKTQTGLENTEEFYVIILEEPLSVTLIEDLPQYAQSRSLSLSGVLSFNLALSPKLLSDTEVQPSEISNEVLANHAGLSINGKSVSLEQGKFESKVDLDEGKNSIILKAWDDYGNSIFEERTVYYDADPPKYIRHSISKEYANGGDQIKLRLFVSDETPIAGAAPYTVSIGDYKYDDAMVKTGDGEYQALFTVPARVSGAVKLKRVTVKDYAGNDKTYTF